VILDLCRKSSHVSCLGSHISSLCIYPLKSAILLSLSWEIKELGSEKKAQPPADVVLCNAMNFSAFYSCLYSFYVGTTVNTSVFHLMFGSIGVFMHYLNCHDENIITVPNKRCGSLEKRFYNCLISLYKA